jgi:hypothetical protein
MPDYPGISGFGRIGMVDPTPPLRRAVAGAGGEGVLLVTPL